MASISSSPSIVARMLSDAPVHINERSVELAGEHAYHPLQSLSHIRLLHLLPASHSDQPLECKIQQKHLPDAIASYEAVSYTWGAPDFSYRLRCTDDNSEFHITKNVDTLLRRFRDEHRNRVFWVDAICINQQDDQEKSTQIPLMGQIYRFASKVLAWLGEGGIEDGAIPLIQSVSRRKADNQDVLTAWPTLSLSHESLREPLKISDPERPHAKVVLQKFFDLAWFHRRWIIQEIVLNAEAYLHYGDHQISWLRFMTTVRAQIDWKNISTNIDSVMKIFKMWRTWSFVSFDEDLGPEDDLLFYLASFDEFKCSDPKDMIYALGALAGIKPAAFKNTTRHTELTFRPNYSQSTEQCYISFAAAAVSRGHLYEILDQVIGRSYGPRGLDLPSWAPDWMVPYRKVDDNFLSLVCLDVKGINDRTMKVEIKSMLLDFTATVPNSSGHIATVTHQMSLPNGLKQSTIKGHLKAFMDESLGRAHEQITKAVTFGELIGGELCFYLLGLRDKSQLEGFRFDGTDVKLEYLDHSHAGFWESPDHWKKEGHKEIGQLEPAMIRTVFLTEVLGDGTSSGEDTESESTTDVRIRYLGLGACRVHPGDKIVGIKGFGTPSTALVVRPLADASTDCGQYPKYRLVGTASLFCIAVSADGTSDQTIADRIGLWFQRCSVRSSGGQWELPISTIEIDLV